IPDAMKKNGGFQSLAPVYKQIEATLSPFGLDTLAASTKALESGNATDDSTYTNLENELISLGNQRDTLATQMIKLLEGAEFNNQPITQQQAQPLIAQADGLLNQAAGL